MQIFELYLEHRSLIDTANELNRRGWTTKQWTSKKGTTRGGAEFNKANLHNLLTNVTYIGKVRYRDEVYDGEHEGIVPAVVFDSVQQLLAHNSTNGGSDTRNKYGALLRGLLRCRPCDCAMSHSYTSKGNRRYRYYVCNNAQKLGWKHCPAPSIPAGEIERFVVEQIAEIGRDRNLVEATWGETKRLVSSDLEALTKERKSLERQLRRNNTELRRLSLLPDQNDMVIDELAKTQEAIRTTERRLREIGSEIESLRNDEIEEFDVAATLANFDELWASLKPREQTRILQLLIDRIEFDGDEVAITFRECGIDCLEGDDQ